MIHVSTSLILPYWSSCIVVDIAINILICARGWSLICLLPWRPISIVPILTTIVERSHHTSFLCIVVLFAVAAVQSKETKSWGAKSVAEEFEIPMLHLASFAADQDRRHVLEKNHHRTSCGFLEL
jgi:hypothetical protein